MSARALACGLLLLVAVGGPAQAQDDADLEPLRRAHRSAKAAILMSIPVPGWGQLYADSPFWSAVAFSAQSFYLGHVLLERRRVERQRVLRDRLEPGSLDRELRDAIVQEHWERVRDFIQSSNLLEVQITVLTPFPGTPLFGRLQNEGRLLNDSAWESCTLFDVNYRPKRMSVEELESGLRWLFRHTYSATETQRRQRHYLETVKKRLSPTSAKKS